MGLNAVAVDCNYPAHVRFVLGIPCLGRSHYGAGDARANMSIYTSIERVSSRIYTALHALTETWDDGSHNVE